jgi:hypothetical protein
MLCHLLHMNLKARRSFLQKLFKIIFLSILLYCPKVVTTINSSSLNTRATTLRFAVPRRRQQSGPTQRCQREVVPNMVNPLAWLYAAGDQGMPFHGLPYPSLTTAGYDDSLFVYQWQGICTLVVLFQLLSDILTRISF